MPQIALLEGSARTRALEALEGELQERLGELPEIFAGRVDPLPAASHVWACFHELDSSRPLVLVPMGLGAMVPLKGALPWGQVGAWLDERGIMDAIERQEVRGLLRGMEAEYQAHQAKSLSGSKAATGPNAGETEG